MAQPFKLLKVDADEDFDKISEVIWDAFEHPLNPFHRIMFYLKSNSPEDRAEAMKITSERLLARHRGDPTSHWIKGRRSATKFLRQCVEHKPRLFNKPHAYLNISATMPAFQRHGAGGMMVEWGLKRADEMGVESFTEATEMGKPLYEHYGFEVSKVIEVNESSMAVDNPSEEWMELGRRLLPTIQYVMWRPVGGKSKKG